MVIKTNGAAPAEQLATTGLMLLLWSVLSLTFFHVFVKPDIYDFYPRWYGARAMLQGRNPYDIDLREENVAGEDFEGYHEPAAYLHFLYPATITYILLPFWMLPFPVALSAWSGLQLLLLLLLPLLVFHLLRWPLKPPVVLLTLLLSALIYRYAVEAYLLGQFVIPVLACIVVAWWQTTENRAWPVALALIAATIRPEGILFSGVFLFALLLMRRFRTIAIWSGIMGGLFLLSVLQIGFWPEDFLNGIRFYRDVAVTSFPLDAVGDKRAQAVFVVGILIWGTWMLWQAQKLPDRERLAWQISVGIAVALLAMRQSKDYTYVYLLFPLWVTLSADRPYSINTLAVFILLIVPRFVLTLQPEHMSLFLAGQLLIPLGTAILLTYQWLRIRPGIKAGAWKPNLFDRGVRSYR